MENVCLEHPPGNRQKSRHTYNFIREFIDVNQAIASCLVDDVSLSWSSYRDELVRGGIDELAGHISTELQMRLDQAAGLVDTLQPPLRLTQLSRTLRLSHAPRESPSLVRSMRPSMKWNPFDDQPMIPSRR